MPRLVTPAQEVHLQLMKARENNISVVRLAIASDSVDHAPPRISWMWPWASVLRAAENDILEQSQDGWVVSREKAQRRSQTQKNRGRVVAAETGTSRHNNAPHSQAGLLRSTRTIRAILVLATPSDDAGSLARACPPTKHLESMDVRLHGHHARTRPN